MRIVDFFYAIRCRIGCNKLGAGWNHVNGFVFKLLYPLWCRMTSVRDGLNHEPRDEKLIISLTSFPARLDMVHCCIRQMLAQTMKPDRIILWLTKEESENVPLPEGVKELQEYGVEVCYADANLKPHNKLYFSLRENPDAVIITVDDDCVYPSDLVERLYAAHQEHPESVCCIQAHEITLRDGQPDLYDNWNGGAIGKSGASDMFIALGVGGVLYPPGCFDEEYFDQELIRSLALTADDLWLKFTELRLGIPVYKIAPHTKGVYGVRGTQKVALGKVNNGMKQNDVIIRKLCDYYQVDWENIK